MASIKYKGLILEKKGNIVKTTSEVRVSIQSDGMIFFWHGGPPYRIYPDELNKWLNVDYPDIDSMMYCLVVNK